MIYIIHKAGIAGYRIETRNSDGAFVGEAFTDTKAQANAWVAESKRRLQLRERSARIRNRLKGCSWLR